MREATNQRRSYPGPFILALLSLLFAMVLVPMAAVAADTEPMIFEIVNTYKLEIAGETVQDARFYQPQNSPALLLIRSAALPSPVMLHFQNQEVATPMGAELPEERADGTLESPADLQWEVQGPMSTAGGKPGFTLGEVSGTIDLADALVGTFDRTTLGEKIPAYAKRSLTYEPDGAVVEQLKKLENPATVKIFFGSYCARCARYLPKMLRVHESLAESGLEISYVGVGKSDSEKQELMAAGVMVLPAAILYAEDGTQLHQIPPKAWEKPEQALLDALENSGADS